MIGYTVSVFQITLAGVLLEHCLISDVVAELEAEIQIADRVRAVSEFNKVCGLATTDMLFCTLCILCFDRYGCV